MQSYVFFLIRTKKNGISCIYQKKRVPLQHKEMDKQNNITMKVLLINAGPHKNGNTSLALSEVAKQLENNGVEAEIV